MTLGFGTPKGPDHLIERINDGEISAAPPRVTPEDLPTVEAVAEAFQPGFLPPSIAAFLHRHPWVKWLILAILILLALVLLGVGGLFGAVVVAALAAGVFELLRRAEVAAGQAKAVTPEGSRPEVVDRLPTFPGFTIRDPDNPGPEPAPAPGNDSPEAARFKLALKDTFTLVDTAAAVSTVPTRQRIDVAGLATASFEAIDPLVTLPAFTFAGLSFPAQLVAINVELFREAMAYPVFDLPTYQPLLDLSVDALVPNLNLLPANSITLLANNRSSSRPIWSGSTTRWPASCSGGSTRPTNGAPRSGSSGIRRASWTPRGSTARRCARSCVTSHPCTAGRFSRTSARSTTARNRATRKRRPSWS